MPRKRQLKKKDHLNPEIWAFLNDAQVEASLTVFLLSDSEKQRLWNLYREEILDKWIAEKPGTRPALWYQYDAPRDLRQQISGKGKTASEQYPAIKPTFQFGIPELWYEIDEHTLYESEAAYLRRHNLFVQGEQKKLTTADFEPVSILKILPEEDE